ncbi:MAG: hypothetical protein K8R48_07965 [Alphaproteobacteria bacterium]|nr:hypothetical protein [Alphaproteobacteria bacterium]
MDNKTDSTFVRAAGAAYGVSYYVKGVQAILKTTEGIKLKELQAIKQNKELGTGVSGFFKKTGHMADHIIKGTSLEGAVAVGAYVGKGALIGLVVAGGPVSTVLTCAAMYFLSTSAGHHLETGVAQAAKSTVGLLVSTAKAAVGNTQELEAKSEVIEKKMGEMKASAKHFLKNMRNIAKIARGEVKWEKKHDHGHGGHHHGKHSSFIGDLKNIAVGAAVIASAAGMAGNKQTPSESKFVKAQTEVAVSAVPKATSSASTYVVTGADIKTAAEKENKVTKAPQTKKSQPKPGM